MDDRPSRQCQAKNLGRVSRFIESIKPNVIAFFVGTSHLTCLFSKFSINRPGGHGKITKIDVEDDEVRLTVKYILGGCDKNLDPCLVEVPEELGTRDRKRRSILTVAPPEESKKRGTISSNKKRSQPSGSSRIVSDSKENALNKKESRKTATKERKAVSESKSKPRRRRSTKKRKTDSTNDNRNESNWPSDLPTEIVVHSRATFASPMTEKGVEDRRSYMMSSRPQGHFRLSPSTLFARSPREEAAAAGYRDDENDPLSDSNSTSNSDDDNDKASVEEEDVELTPHGMDVAAEATSPLAKAPIKRVTIQSVVDREMKEAANFVDDVLQSKPGEVVKKEDKKVKEAPKTSPRQEELMAVFLRLLEHNEGTVEEDGLVEQINQHSEGNKNFTEGEVAELMEELTANDKIMRGDGNIYCF